MSDPSIYQRPSELLQHLIRFNTTNPPGHELACVQHLNNLLQAAGIETTILAKDEKRPNLIARLPGNGGAPPARKETVARSRYKIFKDDEYASYFRGWVDEPIHWRYFSARNYADLPGLLDVETEW